MYESSPRSREVANALFQIDRLTENQVRSVLRHIAIDDAVLNEAQCSHVASVISGTLNKAPREGVNASLTCGTSLDAASHWEKSFASHPGHVSATFRRNFIDQGAEADNSTKQVVLFKAEESAPALGSDVHKDVKPSADFGSDLKGLSIVNQGHLTLHYHSYNEGSSSAYQRATVPLKRTSARIEDEQYSEALSSLMDIDLSPRSHHDPPRTSKRQRIEEPEIEMVEPDIQTPRKEVKQEKEEPAQKPIKNKGIPCKNCGIPFKPNENEGSEQPCRYHPGTFKNYPAGLKQKGKKGMAKKPLYNAWSCCQKGGESTGCRKGKHEKFCD